jgi:hypothetical protein
VAGHVGGEAGAGGVVALVVLVAGCGRVGGGLGVGG